MNNYYMSSGRIRVEDLDIKLKENLPIISLTLLDKQIKAYNKLERAGSDWTIYLWEVINHRVKDKQLTNRDLKKLKQLSNRCQGWWVSCKDVVKFKPTSPP